MSVHDRLFSPEELAQIERGIADAPTPFHATMMALAFEWMAAAAKAVDAAEDPAELAIADQLNECARALIEALRADAGMRAGPGAN